VRRAAHDSIARCLAHAQVLIARVSFLLGTRVFRDLLSACSRWIQSPEPMLSAISDIKRRVENGIQRMIQKRRSAPRAPISAAAAGGSSPAAAAAASSASHAASSVSYVDRVRMWTRDQVREFFTHLELPDMGEKMHGANVDGAKLLTVPRSELYAITRVSAPSTLFTGARVAFLSSDSSRRAHKWRMSHGRVCVCVPPVVCTTAMSGG
jgi:hypothetical protein